jgi:hypothetical protein
LAIDAPFIMVEKLEDNKREEGNNLVREIYIILAKNGLKGKSRKMRWRNEEFTINWLRGKLGTIAHDATPSTITYTLMSGAIEYWMKEAGRAEEMWETEEEKWWEISFGQFPKENSGYLMIVFMWNGGKITNSTFLEVKFNFQSWKE